jgi:asparagine synthase (glutamine-hydrolysing)
MCGIAGVFGEKASKECLVKMLAAQNHRGPDNTGIHITEQAVIGHNRLSIIDLSEAANQPFFSKDNRYVLAFNGEIYNYLELKKELRATYKFTTDSDTEVLLAAYIKWGGACLEKLNGMFAFFIFDQVENKLFAARDRFGVKPLYYSLKEGNLYIASEIKALITAGISTAPNTKVWANYFTYGSYGWPNETFYSTIHQLEGGYYFTYENSVLKKQRWYNFEERVNQETNLTFQQAKEQYLELLKDSIKLRFRADVPIGFNVSGGLDSSLLLSLINTFEEGKNISAYTFYTNNTTYDELPWVNALLEQTNNPLNKVLFSAKDVIKASQEISNIQNEPFGGIPTLAYAQIFKTAVHQGVKVLLDGQGMDEQWAGYDYYHNTKDSVIQGVKASPLRANALQSEFISLASKPIYPNPFEDKVKNLQYRDLFYTKIPRALRFNDRISMAHSTELREPFLDYRLVEFAFKQPLNYKIRNGVQKFLIRSISRDFLPETIGFTPKRPLQTPQREWMANELKDWVCAHVDYLSQCDWFDKKALEKELNLYFEGDQQSSFHLWQWVNASLLISQYNLC